MTLTTTDLDAIDAAFNRQPLDGPTFLRLAAIRRHAAEIRRGGSPAAAADRRIPDSTDERFSK